MLLARSDVGRRGPAMEALFGLYDALEASAQEGLAAPPDGADAAAVAAAGVQLLDELRTRFARLVRRCLMLAVRDCRLARLVRRCHVPGATLSCAGGGVPSARARLLRAALRGRGARPPHRRPHARAAAGAGGRGHVGQDAGAGAAAAHGAQAHLQVLRAPPAAA